MSRGLGSSSYRSYGAIEGDDEPPVGFRGGGGATGGGGGRYSVPAEFHQLCEDITSNIFVITNGITTLDRARKSLGTLRDNQGLRDQIHLTQMSTNQVVNQTTKDLGRLAAMVQRGDKVQKLRMEKLSKDFKASVERYTTLQKEIASGLRRYLADVTRADDEAASSDDRNSLLDQRQERIQAQKSALREEEFERDMLVERESRIRQIESDMLDLNQIMRELSAMVSEQGEVIDTIDQNVETAYGNIEQGADQLRAASISQAKYRKKVCCLCSVLVVIAIVIAVIIIINETGK